jgi:D-alanyl-D-alanine carboxypeptidase (penicillin-binding protein 5/6)
MAQPGRSGRRLLLLAFALFLLATLVAPGPAAAAPIAPAAPASQEPEGYILVDADTGNVLAAKNEHQARLTASTVKILTALVALERLPLDSDVPVSARAASQQEYKINMKEGEVWKLADALRSLLIISANDAAFAIAERASGSVERFADDANATAKRLGARDTTFGDPAGLDDRNAYAGGSKMSAYDLAVVARNFLAVPELANSARQLTYEFTDPTGTQRHLTNHNDGFLTTYPGATGLKTGYTRNANRTLVTSATRDGRTMIAVVLGTWDDTGWAGFLLDQGFTTPATAAGTGAKVPPVRVATADMRRQAFEGLPAALGRPALDGSAATLLETRRAQPVSARRSAPATGRDTPTTAPDSTGTEGTGFSLGQLLDIRIFIAAVCFVLLVLFVLRRRAVKRQRARRLARQRRMAEMRRRRMIDVVEPPARAGGVRVVPVSESRARTRAI